MTLALFAAANDGHECIQCGKPLRTSRGVEVGNIFKLGTRFSEALGATYLDQDGRAHPVVMGSYGIGVGRLLACIAEAYHDEDGLLWPVSIAPYHVHLVKLPGGEDVAETLYCDLQNVGIEVLFDDREGVSPGVRFKDAELIGVPTIVVCGRGIDADDPSASMVEVKDRRSGERQDLPLGEVIGHLNSLS